MRGLRLACRYSCACEHARMYGFTEKLRTFSSGDLDETEAIKMLSELDSKPFYDLIAEKNKIQDPFDIRVVSYYWRGVPELNGGLWHNFTTLLPIRKLHSSHIHPDMVNDCFVHRGKVLAISSKLTIEYFPVVIEQGNLGLSKKAAEREVENLMPHTPKTGDIVAIHFSTAVEKLAPSDANILTAVTHRSLAKFNASRARPKV